MSVRLREVQAKSVLSKTGIPGADYCINAYIGCAHACRYCYASFMKRFTGHVEPWGQFVDAKVNSPAVLRAQLVNAKKGRVLMSSVTDAYQPLEMRYRLTRNCLKELLAVQFPVDILTKSPLVLRDLDIISKFHDLEAGITITTDDEKIRKIFEPKAPPSGARVRALKKLHEHGVRTYVFIGPLLPMNPEALCEQIAKYADSVLIDRMNYVSKTMRIYHRLGLEQWLDTDFVEEIINRLRRSLPGKATVCYETGN